MGSFCSTPRLALPVNAAPPPIVFIPATTDHGDFYNNNLWYISSWGLISRDGESLFDLREPDAKPLISQSIMHLLSKMPSGTCHFARDLGPCSPKTNTSTTSWTVIPTSITPVTTPNAPDRPGKLRREGTMYAFLYSREDRVQAWKFMLQPHFD
ncbi:hypothetical protein K438DRAFT_1772592 [Mycena galopus ATCC 62051]|nr:hypothetical protein K438DRAFT_1772592 [Mycena galopus ATCC 62051]